MREQEKLATVELQVLKNSSVFRVGVFTENLLTPHNLVNVMEYGKSFSPFSSRHYNNAWLQRCLLKLLNSSGYLAGKLPFKSDKAV